MGAVEVDRRDDLEHAGDDRPDPDDERQDDRGDRGEGQGCEPGRDPDDAPPEQRTESLVVFRRLHPSHDGQESIDERIHPEERDEDRKRHSWQDERNNTQEHCQHAA